MTKPQRVGEELELEGGDFGDLCFRWSGDRYMHHWRFRGPATEIGLYSVESDSHAAWPVSPPLQQIHRQSFDDGREVVFGVGMAGRGHWSASFTLIPDLSCWVVELACRATAQPDQLVSSYRLNGQWTPEDGGAVRCDRALRPLIIEPISPTSLAEHEGDILRISPTQIAASQTTQWAFRLRA